MPACNKEEKEAAIEKALAQVRQQVRLRGEKKLSTLISEACNQSDIELRYGLLKVRYDNQNVQKRPGPKRRKVDDKPSGEKDPFVFSYISRGPKYGDRYPKGTLIVCKKVTTKEQEEEIRQGTSSQPTDNRSPKMERRRQRNPNELVVNLGRTNFVDFDYEREAEQKIVRGTVRKRLTRNKRRKGERGKRMAEKGAVLPLVELRKKSEEIKQKAKEKEGERAIKVTKKRAKDEAGALDLERYEAAIDALDVQSKKREKEVERKGEAIVQMLAAFERDPDEYCQVTRFNRLSDHANGSFEFGLCYCRRNSAGATLRCGLDRDGAVFCPGRGYFHEGCVGDLVVGTCAATGIWRCEHCSANFKRKRADALQASFGPTFSTLLWHNN